MCVCVITFVGRDAATFIGRSLVCVCVCVCVGSKREVRGDVLVIVMYFPTHPPTTTYQPYALGSLACLSLTMLCVVSATTTTTTTTTKSKNKNKNKNAYDDVSDNYHTKTKNKNAYKQPKNRHEIVQQKKNKK